MRHFYENVDTDVESMRFWVSCPVCGRKQYGEKIPALCSGARNLERCRKGRGDKLSQVIFNRRKALSVQRLARFFNQCEKCHRFVCDDCYDTEGSICLECKGGKI